MPRLRPADWQQGVCAAAVGGGDVQQVQRGSWQLGSCVNNATVVSHACCLLTFVLCNRLKPASSPGASVTHSSIPWNQQSINSQLQLDNMSGAHQTPHHTRFHTLDTPTTLDNVSHEILTAC